VSDACEQQAGREEGRGEDGEPRAAGREGGGSEGDGERITTVALVSVPGLYNL
jgi:hypothetical protein